MQERNLAMTKKKFYRHFQTSNDSKTVYLKESPRQLTIFGGWPRCTKDQRVLKAHSKDLTRAGVFRINFDG